MTRKEIAVEFVFPTALAIVVGLLLAALISGLSAEQKESAEAGSSRLRKSAEADTFAEFHVGCRADRRQREGSPRTFAAVLRGSVA